MHYTIQNKIRNYLLAGALAIMAIVLARQEWLLFERQARLDAEVVITQGAVRGVQTNKYKSIALVEYAVPGEGFRVREIPVSRPFAHGIESSGQMSHVKVRYLPQNPEVVDILEASEASGWGIAFVLALFALSAWSFNSWRHAKSRISEVSRKSELP